MIVFSLLGIETHLSDIFKNPDLIFFYFFNDKAKVSGYFQF